MSELNLSDFNAQTAREIADAVVIPEDVKALLTQMHDAAKQGAFYLKVPKLSNIEIIALERRDFKVHRLPTHDAIHWD